MSCKKESQDKAAEAPPATPQVVQSGIGETVTVKAPERFALTQAVSRPVVDKLNVTGTVSPDVSRELPVLSLANGRVIALHVRLGDTVKKGELIMEVQSPDVSTAFNGYLKAVNDEHLTAVVLERDKLLFDKGAIAKSQLDIAQNGEDDAKADLRATEQQLRILGVDKNNPSDTVKVYAPTSGIVISQSTTAGGAAGITYAGAGGSLLIADLTHIWVVCDVYENDLAQVHLGQHGDIRLNAYPDKAYTGVVSDIGAVLDPTIRTAKVRFQVQNPGEQMRLGMFATATILGSRAQNEIAVPANAVLHLHDREYVFVPTGAAGTFRRVEIKGGATLPGNLEEVKSGLSAGQEVVANALDLQNTADNE
jgi:cobalt-zinc-cadmium efflux system membrane fusion protein